MTLVSNIVLARSIPERSQK